MAVRDRIEDVRRAAVETAAVRLNGVVGKRVWHSGITPSCSGF